MVRDENLKFMKNRDIYNSDYFNFTLSLASVNAVSSEHSASFRSALYLPYSNFSFILFFQTKLKHPSYQAMAQTSLQLAVQFLFHTYLRTKKKLRWGDAFVYNTSTQGYYR